MRCANVSRMRCFANGTISRQWNLRIWMPPSAPPESLLLQAVEVERHQPLAVCSRVVDAAVAGAEHAQRCLGVLGDALLVPAADRVERRAPDQPHRAAEDDRVAVAARDHRDVEEVAKAVEETAQISVVAPFAIVLRRLHERDRGIVEISDRVAQPLRMHLVVGIHDAEISTSAGKRGVASLSAPALNPGQFSRWTNENRGPSCSAELLERLPERRVGRVVVDDLNQQMRVVDQRQRLRASGQPPPPARCTSGPAERPTVRASAAG